MGVNRLKYGQALEKSLAGGSSLDKAHETAKQVAGLPGVKRSDPQLQRRGLVGDVASIKEYYKKRPEFMRSMQKRGRVQQRMSRKLSAAKKEHPWAANL